MAGRPTIPKRSSVAGLTWLLALGVSVGCSPSETPPSTSPEPAANPAELPMAPTMDGQGQGHPSAQGSGQSEVLSPEAGEFRVLLPAGSERAGRSIQGPNHLSWEVELAANGGSFVVEVMSPPGGIANPDQFLSRMYDQTAQSGSVLKKGPPTSKGRGWSIDLATTDPAEFLRVEMILDRNKAYLLVFSTSNKARLDAPEVVEFFTYFAPKATTGLSPNVASKEGGFDITFAPECGPAFKRFERAQNKAWLSYVSGPRAQTECAVTVVRVDPLPPPEILRAAVDGVVASIPGAKVDSDQSGRRGPHPRRSIELHGVVEGVTLHLRADFIYARDQIYQVQYVSPKAEDLRSKTANAYFDSFAVHDVF